MQDSRANILNISKLKGSRYTVTALEQEASILLEGEKLPSFAEFVLDFDKELEEASPKMRWARKRLFEIYNLYYALDIDQFAPPVRKRKKKGKEKGKEVAA